MEDVQSVHSSFSLQLLSSHTFSLPQHGLSTGCSSVKKYLSAPSRSLPKAAVWLSALAWIPPQAAESICYGAWTTYLLFLLLWPWCSLCYFSLSSPSSSLCLMFSDLKYCLPRSAIHIWSAQLCPAVGHCRTNWKQLSGMGNPLAFSNRRYPFSLYHY